MSEFQFFGPNGPIDPEDLLKHLKEGQRRDKKLKECGTKSATDGYSDIAESMHIMMDEINRSSDLNVAAMLTISKTFDAVFQAFMNEADAQCVDGDVGRKFLGEAGLVDHSSCEHCGSHSANGGIHLHDLQVVAGIAAMRFYLFSRLRKINTCLPLIKEVLDGGDPDTAAAMLQEGMNSVTGMMSNLNKMGLTLIPEHPVAIKATEGMFAAGKLAVEISKVKARQAKGEG